MNTPAILVLSAMLTASFAAAAQPTDSSAVIHQMGRWRTDVCPRVDGLQPTVNAFVARRVTEIARSVGAPAREFGKSCAVNVVIVFTLKPQQLLDHIAKAYPSLLGSARSPGDTIFRRPVQSWYVTGTKQMDAWAPPIGLETMMMELQAGIDASTPPGGLASDGARVDPAHGGGYQGNGRTGSYFEKGLTSEFLQVLIIVDSAKVAADSRPS